jgi:hypothetical protein
LIFNKIMRSRAKGYRFRNTVISVQLYERVVKREQLCVNWRRTSGLPKAWWTSAYIRTYVYVDYVFSEYTGNILPLLINTSIYLYFMSRKHLDSLTNNFIITAYSLGLRQLYVAVTMMDYYIWVFFPWLDSPKRASALKCRYHNQTQHIRQDSSGPLIGPSRRPLTTYNTHERQTSMPLVKFEPATPASERQQTCALHRAATGIGITLLLGPINFVESVTLKNVSIVHVLVTITQLLVFVTVNTSHFLKQYFSFSGSYRHINFSFVLCNILIPFCAEAYSYSP